ncbi:GNAT family N-acetyltransferase [Halorubrum coriense]|uniref:GNAT family N-acetyltransferase n=1 Tax=Halorubrum coriense TaxID=64713 RepID=UPI0009B5CEDA|nr:GNAT family N-acetyltransferase [Halorubrum coriense]
MGPPGPINVQMDDPFVDDSKFRLKAREQNAPGLVGWLNANTSGADFVKNPPYIDVDLWAVMDDKDKIAAGVAIESVDDPDSITELHRIAVAEDYRSQGLGSTLVEQIAETYGSIGADCPIESEANGWYYHTGWDYRGVNRASDPNLVRWHYTSD